MKLFAQTLSDCLKKIIHPVIMDKSSSHELRIFLSSQPPQIIYKTGCDISEFLSTNPSQIQFEFKIGTALWENWNKTSLRQEDKLFVDKIKNEGWVDEEDKLTHYRNLKWSRESGYDYLIIILVGVDLARDQGSLQDFFTVDSKVIWNSVLKKSFKPWIQEVYGEQNDPVYSNKEHLEEANALLKVLHTQGAGDLLKVSNFLGQLNLNGLPDGNEGLRVMYEGLQFWDLPVLQDMPFRSRTKWTTYVKDASVFFSYRDLLKNSERQKVLKKIDQFELKFQAGDEDYPLYPNGEFTELSELLSCLRGYVSNNCSTARARLLRTDFAPVRDRILKLRTPKPVGPGGKTPAITKIDAPPLEAVLNALWQCMIDFKKVCNKTNVVPSEAITRISLEGLEFRHDLDDDNDGLDLLKGCIGGLDNFLEKKLHIEFDVDDSPKKITINSRLLPEDLKELSFKKAGAGTPGFQFIIYFHTNDESSLKRKFQWQLPETHAYRNLWNFVRRVHGEIPTTGPCLPIFTMPYYDEIFRASDEAEANRILKLGHKNLKVKNLLDQKQLNQDDPLLPKILDLSYTFGKFLKAFVDEGIFSALGDPWIKFHDTYKKIFEELVRNKEVGPNNYFAPLMYKAFAIISYEDSNTPYAQHLQSAVLTGIHPALLEMIQNREAFLIHGFIEESHRFLAEASGLKMTLQQWENVCDLSTIKYPLFGLVAGENQRLDTNITSRGLIHCVGTPSRNSPTLSTKALLQSQDNDDDEMSDSFLFKESRESRVIKRLLDDYVDIYPNAADGISVAVINADNIQTIVAGIDAFLKGRLSDIDELSSTPPYHFSLNLFTLDSQQQEATSHLEEWRRRWEASNEPSSKFGYYQNCRLSVAHRVANNTNQGITDYLNLVSRNNFNVDLAILVNFINVGKMVNYVERIDPFQYDLKGHLLKFPILEMPRCCDFNLSKEYIRATVVSNRRFRLATLHSELGVYFEHPDNPIGQEYIIVSQGNYGNWSKLLDKLHDRSTWVFCLDSAIDERLVSGQNGVSEKNRDIIGFSSGLGFRGELNYTLSTEQSSLLDIEREISKQVRVLCGITDQVSLNQCAHFLTTEARKLSGLSLVRAAGGGERHIRELIASTLVYISRPDISDQGLRLCDELISLDAFIHWFESAKTPERPDLLRLVVFLQEDGMIAIHAHIVECKLAQRNPSHLEKARTQLESGLRHLMTVFKPNVEGEHHGVFDQRYWWAQLQRLIACKSHLQSEDQKKITLALESLGEGNFRICWKAMAVAYWTDSDSLIYEKTRSWDFVDENRRLSIDVICAGSGIISQISSNPTGYILPCTDETLCLPPNSPYCDQVEVEDIDEKQDTYKFSVGEESSTTSKSSVIDGVDIERESSEYNSEHCKNAPKTSIESKSSLLDTENDEEASVISKKENIPKQIFLGKTIGNVEKEIFWEFGHPQLTNRHFLIFGKSGVGKTYAIQSILMELASENQNSVIVDYTSGFLKTHLEQAFKDAVNPTGHIVKKSPLPINPFRKQRLVIDEDYEDIEDSYSVAGRITSVFSSVYSSFGEQQKALLHKTIEQGIDSNEELYDFAKLLDDLEKEESPTALSIANKLTPLGRASLFAGSDTDSWKAIYSDRQSKVNILQLAGLSRELAKMATEFILWDMYDFASNQGNKDRPLPIVLDEIQNLNHSLDAPLAKMLTEGRKFGISAILATQTLSNLPQEARDRLFMATHKLFFKPAETELKEYAAILANATGEKIDQWKDRLAKLNKGECYSLGPALNTRTDTIEEKTYPIKINSLEERIKRVQKNA